MKIYVAGHSQADCKEIAEKLIEDGQEITSSWLYEEFKKTSEYTEQERVNIAIKDIKEVRGSDAVMLLASPKRVPGGKFIEVGVALGLDKTVYLIGHRENMLMHHQNVWQYDSIEDYFNLRHMIPFSKE